MRITDETEYVNRANYKNILAFVSTQRVLFTVFGVSVSE